jgi:outer membrane protein assembly factor BamB
MTGKNAWPIPFQTGNAVLDPPIIGDKVVYQYVDVQGLYAIDKKSGRKIWQVEAGLNLLAENGSLAYVIAQPGLLVVMNNSTGKKLYSVNLAAVTDYAVNTTDSAFYIADNNGRLMSIKTKGLQR